MNQLSWLLLAADIIGSIVDGLLVAGAILAFLSVVRFLMWADDSSTKSDAARSLRKSKMLAGIAAFLFLVCAFVPSQRMIYMIAASEMGEAAGVPEELDALYGDLKAIIHGLAMEAVQ